MGRYPEDVSKAAEKMALRIDRALDLKTLTDWERDFLTTVRNLLRDRFKWPSPKQKNMAFKILVKHKVPEL